MPSNNDNDVNYKITIGEIEHCVASERERERELKAEFTQRANAIRFYVLWNVIKN